MNDNVVDRNISFTGSQDRVKFNVSSIGDNTTGYIPVAEFDSEITVRARSYDFYCYPTFTTPNEVKLVGVFSEAPDSVEVTWGDGTSDIVTTQQTDHVYAAPGNYQVFVYVTYVNAANQVGQESVEFAFNVEV